jgi:glycosyltransferase involved in cell wall biosynthesis
MTRYSVLMSVYAKEKPSYFRESLDSVLRQTAPPEQVVLVCDGPLGADLEAVVDGFASAHPDLATLVRLPENAGLGPALNAGLAACRCELVARMDTDDIAVPDRMQRQLAAFEETEGLAVLSAAVAEFRNDDPDDVMAVRRVPLSHEEIVRFARRRCPFNHPCAMYRKSAVLSVGGYRVFPLFEDYHLWVRMLMDGAKARNLPDVLLRMRAGEGMYRRRGGFAYLRKSWAFRRFLLSSGFASLADVLAALIPQAFVTLLPNRLRMAAYRSYLRGGPA